MYFTMYKLDESVFIMGKNAKVAKIAGAVSLSPFHSASLCPWYRVVKGAFDFSTPHRGKLHERQSRLSVLICLTTVFIWVYFCIYKLKSDLVFLSYYL